MLRRVRSAKLVDRPLEFRTLAHGGVATQAFVITNHIRRLKMSKYRVEMIIEVNEGHPRKWIPESIAEQLNEGEDILEWDIKEIEDE